MQKMFKEDLKVTKKGKREVLRTKKEKKKKMSISQKISRLYWGLVTLICMEIINYTPVFAAGDTIWSRFSTIMKDIYGEIIGISTIVGVTMAAIALIIRMISRNQRAVDEATNWLKRIVVTWIVLNSLGFVVAYLQPLIAGGAYTGQ